MILPIKTNTIDNKRKTWVLITFAGSHHFITDEQELAIRKMSANDRIYTEKGMVRASTIKEIMTIEGYYELYPERRPEQIKEFKAPEWKPFTKEKKIRALEQMIKGITKHIDGLNYQGTDKPIKLQELMLVKLQSVKNNSSDNFENPVQEIKNSIF